MSDYEAPLRDMRFVLRELAGLDRVLELPGYEEVSADVVDAVLEQAGKLAREVLAPLNRTGDRDGARLEDAEVRTPRGWREAYRQFIGAGWNGLASDPEYGGQGLPRLVWTPVEEMCNSANVSFTLCPMLTRSAIDAIELRGSDELKRTYLPRLVSGEWTGTMLLTEPQAGSDLAAVRTRAERRADGTYSLFGQKIFITYGEHDLTDNIVHLVLARTAPAGVKGLSLFVVPKFLVDGDGSLGARNDLRCVALEHKLGIHASPTCVMAFGDQGGATGYLVGEENRGIEYMFIMMNAARFAVGLEGVGLAERAYQQALAHARERVQGTEAGAKGAGRVPIIRHPDVRRMLLLMKSQTEAMRALAGVVGAAMDLARRHPDAAERERQQAFVDLMIPVVKGWSTEKAVEIASLGVQVHGGMGFIEETGAAQYLRDARITPIYEGTTGIQANDLVGRKIARDGGQAAHRVIEQMRAVEQQLGAQSGETFAAMRVGLASGIAALDEAVRFIVASFTQDSKRALAGAVPMLELFGIVAGGWQMARAALAAQQRLAAGDGDAAFCRGKIATARFYADHVLAQAPGLSYAVARGADGVLAMEDDQF